MMQQVRMRKIAILVMICSMIGMLLPATFAVAAESDYVLINKLPQTKDMGQLNGPVGVAIDADGNRYVTDSNRKSVVKYDPDGHYVLQWSTNPIVPIVIAVDSDTGVLYVSGHTGAGINMYDTNGNHKGSFGDPGNGVGQFNRVYSIASDDLYLYLADVENDRIQVFDKSNPIAPVYYGTIGTKGSGDGQFMSPMGVGVDDAHNLFVTDAENHRIQMFTYDDTTDPAKPMWTYDSQIGTEGITDSDSTKFHLPTYIGVQQYNDKTHIVFLDSGNKIFKHITIEASKYHLTTPYVIGGFPDVEMVTGAIHGIAFDPATEDRIHIANSESIQIVDRAGNLDLNDNKSLGATKPDRFMPSRGVAVDSEGNIYIADIINHRIIKYARDGTFVKNWGKYGSGDGEFESPMGLAIDHSDNVYVVEIAGARVQKFTSDGAFITKWGSVGTLDGEFDFANGAAIDSMGSVYVTSNGTIQKFTSDGIFLKRWDSLSPWLFKGYTGIAIDADGFIYAVDPNNNRVEKLNSDLEFVSEWGVSGDGPGEFNMPLDVAIDGSGKVFVTDEGNHRVQVFNTDGDFITSWGNSSVFNQVTGIAVDKMGNILVMDSGNNQLFTYQERVPVAPPVILSSNANLKALTVNEGALDPAFDAATKAYAVKVDYEVTEIRVIATVEDIDAKLSIADVSQESGKERAIKLDIGNNSIEIVVTAQDDTKQIYRIDVTRSEQKTIPVTPVNPPIVSIAFTDIAGHWAKTSIEQAAGKGITQGYPDLTFRPNHNITRAEYVVLLSRTLGWEQVENPKATFADQVPTWAQTHVSYAVEEGIIEGYLDETFRAEQPITRAEAVTMMIRALKLDVNSSAKTEFADDRDIPTWARGSVAATVEQGLIEGRSNHTFVPNDPISRAESVVLMLRMLDFSKLEH